MFANHWLTGLPEICIISLCFRHAVVWLWHFKLFTDLCFSPSSQQCMRAHLLKNKYPHILGESVFKPNALRPFWHSCSFCTVVSWFSQTFIHVNNISIIQRRDSLLKIIQNYSVFCHFFPPRKIILMMMCYKSSVTTVCKHRIYRCVSKVQSFSIRRGNLLKPARKEKKTAVIVSCSLAILPGTFHSCLQWEFLYSRETSQLSHGGCFDEGPLLNPPLIRSSHSFAR